MINYKMQLAAMMNPAFAKHGISPTMNNVNDTRLMGTIGNLQDRMRLAGVEPPEQKRKINPLTFIFENLDRPRNAIMTAISRGQQGMNPLEGLWAGLKRDEVTRGSDILQYSGMDKGVGRAALGFAMDVGLDPMTYLGAHLIKGAKGAIGAGMKAVPTAGVSGGKYANLAQMYTAGKAGAKEAIKAVPLGAKTVGQVGDDVSRWMGKAFNKSYVHRGDYPEVLDIGALQAGRKKVVNIHHTVGGRAEEVAKDLHNTVFSPLVEKMRADGMTNAQITDMFTEISKSAEYGKTIDALTDTFGLNNFRKYQDDINQALATMKTNLSGSGFASTERMNIISKAMYGKPYNKLTQEQGEALFGLISDDSTHGALRGLVETPDVTLRRRMTAGGKKKPLKLRGAVTDDAVSAAQETGMMDKLIQRHQAKRATRISLRDMLDPSTYDARRMTHEAFVQTADQQDKIANQVKDWLMEQNVTQPSPYAREMFEQYIAPRYNAIAKKLGLEPEKFIENYVTHLYDNTPAEVLEAYRKMGIIGNPNATARKGTYGTDFFATKERLIASDDIAESLGLKPIRDIRAKLATYEMAYSRSEVRRELFEDLAKMDLNVLRNVRGKDVVKIENLVSDKKIEGYVRGSKVLKDPAIANKWIHPEIVDAIKSVDDHLSNVAEMHSFMKVFGGLTSKWKGLVTGPNPNYHLNNMFGNMFNNMIARDIGLREYLDALAIQQGAKDGIINLGKNGVELSAKHAKLLGFGDEAVRVFQMTPEQFQSFYRFHSVDRVSELGQMAYGTTQKSAQRAAIERFIGKGERGLAQKLKDLVMHPVHEGHYYGEMVESNARIAHFLGKIRAGNTAEESAQSVLKFLFDYSDLTRFEKNVIAPFIPFYTWTRKSIPLHLSQMVKDPDKYLKLYHAMQGSRAGFGVPTENMPDWLEHRAFGTPIDGVLATPNLSMDAINRLEPSSLVASINPLIRTPLELFFNQQAFNQKPIEEFAGQKKPIGIGGLQLPAKYAYAFSQLGINRNPLARASVTGWDMTMGDPTNQPRAWEDMKRQLQVGLIRDYDEKAWDRAAMYRYRDQLLDMRRALGQQGVELPQLNRGQLTPQQAKLLLARMMMGGR